MRKAGKRALTAVKAEYHWPGTAGRYFVQMEVVERNLRCKVFEERISVPGWWPLKRRMVWSMKASLDQGLSLAGEALAHDIKKTYCGLDESVIRQGCSILEALIKIHDLHQAQAA